MLKNGRMELFVTDASEATRGGGGAGDDAELWVLRWGWRGMVLAFGGPPYLRRSFVVSSLLKRC